MPRVLLACLLASVTLAAHAQSSGVMVPLDDGSLVVAGGSGVCHHYSTLEKLATAFLGLGYGYGGETFDSAAFGLSSVTADGQANLQFGKKAVVITPLLPAKNHDAAFPTALVRDARGRLIAVGWRTQILWPDNGVILITAARYSPSGAIDTTFGERGIVTVRVNRDGVTDAAAAAIDTNGRLVTVGYNGGRKVRSKLGSFDEWTNHLVVTRLTEDGRLDASFGKGGFAMTDILPAPPTQTVNPNCKQDPRACEWLFKEGLKGHEREHVRSHPPAGMVIDGENRIIAGVSASDGTLILARFLPDGSLDPAFGSGGMTRTPMPPESSIAVLLRDGAGRLFAVATPGGHTALLRYSAAGVLDRGFGTNGVRDLPFAKELTPAAAVLAADGHLFVGAYDRHTLAIGLFDAEGTPIKDFGRDGILSAPKSQVMGPPGLVVNAAGEPTVAAPSDDGVAMLYARRTGSAAASRRFEAHESGGKPPHAEVIPRPR